MGEIGPHQTGQGSQSPTQSQKLSDSKSEARKEAARLRARLSYLRRKAKDPDAFRKSERERNNRLKQKDPEKWKKSRRESTARLVAKDVEAHRKVSAERQAKRRKKNPEKYEAANKRWRDANPDKVKDAARRRWRRYVSDPANALRARVSRLVRASLRRGHKSASIERTLGFSIDELRAHLERQFLPGMGWHNMSEWHIDHIVPVSSFKFSSDADPEFSRAWHITNLRPLWGSDNVRKGSRRVFLV